MITAAEIASRLAAQIESLVRELLPQGKREGNEWCVGSVAGEPGSSCKIHLTGDKAGVWRDFAGEDGGDALDLWAAVRGVDLGEACRQACAYLGISKDAPGRRQKEYKLPGKPAEARALASAPIVVAWLKAHGISEETAKAYNVRAFGDNALLFPFMRDGKVLHIQYRDIAEKRFWASADTEPCLFGWQAIPPRARDVVIAEGMKDALSWYQLGFPALSVPAGGGKKQANWIEGEFERLQRFDRIYISMDADETGQQAVEEIVDRIGRHRCFVVRLPEGFNDINDCLTGCKGERKAVPPEVIRECVRTARTMDPETLVNVGDFSREIIEHFWPPNRIRGIASPFQQHDGCFEMILGATTILAGWNGSGKTTMAGQFILDAMRQGFPACVASLEFRVPRYVGWLVRQALCDAQPQPEFIEEAVEKLSDTLWAFSPGRRGEQGSSTIEHILDTWEYACSRYGTKLLVLDNLSKILFSASDELSDQRRAITLLTEFAVKTNTHVIVVAHSRKKVNEHEEVSKLDVKGSGTITDLADNVLIVHRNKKKEGALKDPHLFQALPIEEQSRIQHQPDSWLSCEKQRHYNGSGEGEPRISLWFDREAKQFVDRQRGTPRRYL